MQQRDENAGYRMSEKEARAVRSLATIMRLIGQALGDESAVGLELIRWSDQLRSQARAALAAEQDLGRVHLRVV